jgi:glyoxylase-like metal-dependent hydrolase (beta-lactamase superfamily II)
MIWKEIRDENLGCNSFLLGDEVSGKGLVVDPLGSAGAMEYILTAQDLGISIEHVVETHIHADHRSAAKELAGNLGIKITFGKNAQVNFDYVPVEDGSLISLGSIEVEVMETPGHTMESISLVVRDRHRGDEPILVMSGDSLFVGDVGRPDLNDADDEIIRKYSEKQFHSIQKIMKLPDFTELHPAHYGASPCGGLFMSKKPSSTIGYERRYNVFTAIKDKGLFVEKQIKLLKPPPEEAIAIRAENLGPIKE